MFQESAGKRMMILRRRRDLTNGGTVFHHQTDHQISQRQFRDLLRGDRQQLREHLFDVESRGGATLLRFSEASLRRAMDRGRTSETILEFLEAHARPLVPQPLKFLIEDVGRRHGQIRMGSASTYLRADDPALLATVVNHRKMAKAGLRLIAPNVAVSTMEEPKLLRLMRDAGFLPMPELADGTLAPASHAPDREVFERDFGERSRSEGQRAWNEGLHAGDQRSQLIDPSAYKLAVRLKQR